MASGWSEHHDEPAGYQFWDATRKRPRKAAEHRARALHAPRRALREHVLSLLDEGRKDRGELADLILLLLDGAVTEAYLKGIPHPAGAAKRAASRLLKAA